MAGRRYSLGAASVPLPRGTRVVLRTDVRGEDGFVHRQASLATVRDSSKNVYHLRTPSGRELVATRDQITVQRQDLLQDLGQRVWAFEALEPHVIYAGIVGSQAWGLAGPSSDEDVRGCFVLPFEDHVSLWEPPDEIQDPAGDAAYWEIEKLLHQGLRGDANTLEALWTPLIKTITPLGRRLRDERRMFVSMNVLGSFGRYAQSQFEKIQRSLTRNEKFLQVLDDIDAGREPAVEKKELTAMVRSIFDRGLIEGASYDLLVAAVRDGRRKELEPPPHRPKNAYNLLRLLHSCLSWLRTGEPLIEVEGDLKTTLLAIKNLETPIEETLAMAQEVAAEVDEVAKSATLPEAPDYDAADALLAACRRRAAARVFGATGLGEDLEPEMFPVELPADVDVAALQRFLAERAQPPAGRTLWIALSGSHAYGFPSADSDLDVKGTFLPPVAATLGLSAGASAVSFLGDFEGREYDLTLNELKKTIVSILAGNGNYVERFLGPLPLLVTPLGRRVRSLTKRNLSRRVLGHYRGFMVSIEKRYAAESAEGVRKAKRLLYVYRSGLTGLHLLRTGEVETDVTKLAPEYGYERVAELVRVKASAEVVTIEDDRPYLEDLERLGAALPEAATTSVLPEIPAEPEAFEAMFVELVRAGDST